MMPQWLRRIALDVGLAGKVGGDWPELDAQLAAHMAIARRFGQRGTRHACDHLVEPPEEGEDPLPGMIDDE